MPRQPSPARRVALLVAGALALGAVSVALDAATAHAATVGRQAVLRPPAVQPIEFVGRRYTQGRPIPTGHAIVRRKVTMAPKEHPATVRLRCPSGLFAITPGSPEGSELSFNVADLRQYDAPRRVFALQVRPAPPAFVTGPTASGSVYLMCGPRRLAPHD